MKKLKGLLKTRTFWVGLVSGVGTIVNHLSGEVIPTETAVSISTALTWVMRLLTKKSV